MTDTKPLIERVLKENIECYNRFPLGIDVSIARKCCEIIEKEARRETLEEIKNYLKERKRNAKNLYQMDHVTISPSMFLNMISKLIEDIEKRISKS